jgi:hypothetical protein
MIVAVFSDGPAGIRSRRQGLEKCMQCMPGVWIIYLISEDVFTGIPTNHLPKKTHTT